MSIANIKRYAMRNIKLKPMAQQTAVGWLIMQLPVKIRVELYEKNIHEQALQMEKEQIMNAFFMGRDEITKKFVESSEQYYNETYKQ